MASSAADHESDHMEISGEKVTNNADGSTAKDDDEIRMLEQLMHEGDDEEVPSTPKPSDLQDENSNDDAPGSKEEEDDDEDVSPFPAPGQVLSSSQLDLLHIVTPADGGEIYAQDRSAKAMKQNLSISNLIYAQDPKSDTWRFLVQLPDGSLFYPKPDVWTSHVKDRTVKESKTLDPPNRIKVVDSTSNVEVEVCYLSDDFLEFKELQSKQRKKNRESRKKKESKENGEKKKKKDVSSSKKKKKDKKKEKDASSSSGDDDSSSGDDDEDKSSNNSNSSSSSSSEDEEKEDSSSSSSSSSSEDKKKKKKKKKEDKAKAKSNNKEKTSTPVPPSPPKKKEKQPTESAATTTTKKPAAVVATVAASPKKPATAMPPPPPASTIKKTAPVPTPTTVKKGAVKDAIKTAPAAPAAATPAPKKRPAESDVKASVQPPTKKPRTESSAVGTTTDDQGTSNGKSCILIPHNPRKNQDTIYEALEKPGYSGMELAINDWIAIFAADYTKGTLKDKSNPLYQIFNGGLDSSIDFTAPLTFDQAVYELMTNPLRWLVARNDYNLFRHMMPIAQTFSDSVKILEKQCDKRRLNMVLDSNILGIDITPVSTSAPKTPATTTGGKKPAAAAATTTKK